MEITISVTRRKVDNTILETFIISPRHSYINDLKRKPKRLIWKTIIKKSIADRYKVLDISWADYCITIKLEFSDRDIDFPMQEIIKFNYHPVLGEKRCSKCKALKIFNGQMYCRTKSKKIDKNSWYKCQEWQENVEIELI